MLCLNQRHWSAGHGSVLSRSFPVRTRHLQFTSQELDTPRMSCRARGDGQTFFCALPAAVNRLSAWSQAGKWKLRMIRSMLYYCYFPKVSLSVVLHTLNIGHDSQFVSTICMHDHITRVCRPLWSLVAIRPHQFRYKKRNFDRFVWSDRPGDSAEAPMAQVWQVPIAEGRCM